MAFKLNVSPVISLKVVLSVGLALVFFLGALSVFGRAQTGEQPTMQFEFQFTDGFSGQGVSISVEGQVVAEFTAQTKFQTGLAHIAMLDLPDLKEVIVAIGELDIELHLDVDAKQPFVVFVLQDGALIARMTDKRPGYL